MKVAPFRALTHFFHWCSIIYIHRGNEGRPIQGIDTLLTSGVIHTRAPRGNEGRPIQGIDTRRHRRRASVPAPVEMKVTPFRALTQHVKNQFPFAEFGGNEGRPTPGHNHKLKRSENFLPIKKVPWSFSLRKIQVYKSCNKA